MEVLPSGSNQVNSPKGKSSTKKLIGVVDTNLSKFSQPGKVFLCNRSPSRLRFTERLKERRPR